MKKSVKTSQIPSVKALGKTPLQKLLHAFFKTHFFKGGRCQVRDLFYQNCPLGSNKALASFLSNLKGSQAPISAKNKNEKIS